MKYESFIDRIGCILFRAVLIVGLVCLMGSGRCASAPTTKQAEAAVADVEDLEGWIEQSNLPPETKAKAKEKATSVKTTITEQGQAIVKKDEKIASLEGYKKLVVGFCVAAGLAILAGGFFGIRWLIRRASPI